MGDFTDATAQELDRQSDGLKNQAVHLRADAKDKIARAESLEEAARLLWHRGYIIDRDSAAAAAEVERLTAQLDEAVRLMKWTLNTSSLTHALTGELRAFLAAIDKGDR